MTQRKSKKSHLLETIQFLIFEENKPDYKIAAMCGVAPTTILNLRQGNHVPSVVMAEAIYEILSGKSLGEFNL
tara:strand:+ start:663 stop:881 length:219 start_codon:yes stop_codon:yes gene_type:complete